MRTTVLVGMLIGLLVWMCWQFGPAGMIGWIVLAFIIFISKRADPTPEKKQRRETGYIMRNGSILWDGKYITQDEAERRGLRLAYPERPKPKKKSFFKAWRNA